MQSTVPFHKLRSTLSLLLSREHFLSSNGIFFGVAPQEILHHDINLQVACAHCVPPALSLMASGSLQEWDPISENDPCD